MRERSQNTYVAVNAMRQFGIEAGDEVTAHQLGLTHAQFDYYVKRGYIKVEEGEQPQHVYDVHHL